MRRSCSAPQERLGIPVTVTEQYPKGLGPTVDWVADALPTGTVIVPKLSFAATSDEAFGARVTTLRGEGRDQAVICGAEAHVCVLQTALGLKAQGFEVFVPGDAVSSRSPQRGCRSGTAPPGGLQVGDDGDGRVRMA